jgi:transposase-like protein
VQPRRDKAAAEKLMRKLLRKQGFAPNMLVTDKLRSCGAAMAELGLSARHEEGLRKKPQDKDPRGWVGSDRPRRPRQLPT